MNKKMIGLLGLTVASLLGASSALAQETGVPYKAYGLAYFSAGASVATVNFQGPHAVPFGKRLLIESITYRLTLVSGQDAACTLWQDGVAQAFLPAAVRAFTAPAGYASHSHGVLDAKVLLSEGTYSVNCSRLAAASTGTVQMVVTGTIVDG